ncbi:hypothetical protein QN345_16155 [Cryobacterium sp. 10I1]|uniref:hypothetical protein n=1 Tax=unclassified Cryobacterium TaxID=2649013 RepID=UPI002AC8ED66|nr:MULTISPECIES: hypothetical protein [unclassified Cryobacterium]MEB0003122.1 hypothetical protein [Cryobacterium sp. RTC2.1]MEB0286877.1 hypothetical protein [Cryobacterium sp. 10S3]MEB0306834.1 hypothetical protein [Cryobacterium sp. 10I1]WPX13441.1 hypothetical protein RHM57_17510 [Cryobacterium sp. 10S3]
MAAETYTTLVIVLSALATTSVLVGLLYLYWAIRMRRRLSRLRIRSPEAVFFDAQHQQGFNSALVASVRFPNVGLGYFVVRVDETGVRLIKDFATPTDFLHVASGEVIDLRVEKISAGFRQRWRILLSVSRENRVELPIYLNGSGGP